ncbi:hypothetical protein IU459_13165 [Nocardia amamiensis]|uniref:Uncharacterized protein n=1 Tax=Nocardia amamiensis TaxID=404578 RepID=A0ABS0CRP4_9NOCA|nr:hypothetical protein [Nocardia amamiensis]MBF6298488.1 hypothetical protein [Nocardia amamiensis]
MSTDNRTMADLIDDLIRSDGLDAAVAAYYARRVPHPREALWRTDYTRAYILRDRAEDAPRRDHPDAIALWAQARAIEQRWTADPAVAPRWAELDEMLAHTVYPGLFHPEPPTMPSEPPPGMDPTTWRSRLQVRDMTGHGRWPDTSTTRTDHEGAEPMTNLSHEHETESITEQQMRADFMHAWSYAQRMTPEDYDPADQVAYGEYADRWTGGEEQWADEWLYLEDATTRWRDDRAGAERQLAFHQRADLLSPIEARSEDQARYIAAHGIERDEHGLLTSHYVTRVPDWAAGAAGSALADYQPGNVLAASRANSERDGAER